MSRRALLAAAVLALAPLGALPALAAGDDAYGSPELIAAAKKEGTLTLYTANFTETEQAFAAEFNKRFPFVKVAIVRAPGGQLLTRIRSEAAAGKLGADMIEISDRAQAKSIEDLFADYAPPNAADYPEKAITVANKLWPRTSNGWVIAWNEALVKNPPKSWEDLTKPEYKKQIGQIVAISGGTTWTLALYQRQVLGEDYWPKLAKNDTSLYPSGAPLSDAVVRGEVPIAPLQSNIVLPKIKEGAPVGYVVPSEGTPITVYATGIPKTAANPNAAKLFMNWSLSMEGQTVQVKQLGMISTLKGAPVPEGIDPAKIKPWYPDPKDYETLREKWINDWNVTFNYRQ